MNDVLLMRAAWADVRPDGFRIITQMQLLSPPLRTAVRSVTSRQRWVDSVTRSEFPVSALKAVWIISHSVSGGVSGWLFVSICQPCAHLTTCLSPYDN